jgi:hypothetical protein
MTEIVIRIANVTVRIGNERVVILCDTLHLSVTVAVNTDISLKPDNTWGKSRGSEDLVNGSVCNALGLLALYKVYGISVGIVLDHVSEGVIVGGNKCYLVFKITDHSTVGGNVVEPIGVGISNVGVDSKLYVLVGAARKSRDKNDEKNDDHHSGDSDNDG